MRAKLKKLSENDRIVISNMIGAFGVKGLALLISLMATPAYIQFFHDQTTLGLWFTINSVLSWILNFDLGIGNGLRNHLTKSYSEHNEIESRKYISSAYLSVGLVCCLVAGGFVVGFKYINWNSIFNISEDVVSRSALLTTVIIVFLGIILQLFLKLINSILYAIQKSSINNFLSLCTSIITLLCLYMLPSGNNDSNVIIMSVAHLLAVNIPLIVASVIVFTKTQMRKCAPHFKFFRKKHAKEVLSLGGMFLFVQIAYMVMMSTNEYLIAKFCSNEWVVEYQLYYKPFSIGGTVFSLALTPVWSAVTKAFAEKDFNWISGLYRKLLVLSAIGSIASFMLILFLQPFMDIWLGKDYFIVNNWYAAVFAALSALMMVNSVLSSFANGIGKLKVQAGCFAFGAIIKIPIAYIIIIITNSWIGVVLANVIAMLLYCIVQPVTFRKELKR